MANMTGALSSTIAREHYDGVTKTFHWLIFALVAVQYLLGFTMPEIHRNPPPPQLLNSLHMSLGTLILVLILARFVWRLGHPVPQLAELPRWQQNAAVAVHLLLYAILVVDPVLGWIGANAHGWSVTVFGVITLPDLVVNHSPIGRQLSDLHITLAYVLLGVIGLHVLAAFYHYFITRDRVMQRMLPGG